MTRKILISIFIFSLFLPSCDNGLDEINSNPNAPEVVPSFGIFNSATKELIDDTRDEWWGGRFTYPFSQYVAQVNYTEEDRFQVRESTILNGWNDLYLVAQDFKQIILLNEDPATKNQMAAYGKNENQIAAARIMLSYVFLQLADTFGDVPYYSYGSDDADFQALNLNNLTPKYASQSKIYPDILKELREAADMLDTAEPVFTSGDNIYDGDASKWKKFANSLSLRVGNRIKDVYPSAMGFINDAIADGVFTSNSDNAKQAYGSTSTEASPLYSAFFLSNRTDFAVASTLVDLLKGETGPNNGVFDPRLSKYAAPASAPISAVQAGSYSESSNPADYEGMPYGVKSDEATLAYSETTVSFMSTAILSIDASYTLMDYAEVCFILSELNNWDQTHYENGITASLEDWGVSSGDISSYVSSVAAADDENVLTQKYIALYLNGAEAWAEYRRTGYPDVMLLPFESGTFPDGVTTYVFEPLIGGENEIPFRMTYPTDEFTLNSDSYSEAVSNLSLGDNIYSPLWWQ